MSSRIRVVLVEDHPLFRDGLRALLEPEADVVGATASAVEARTLIRALGAAVAFIDLVLPDGDGLRVTEEVTRGSAGTRVIMMSAHTTELVRARAFAAGARGFVSKSGCPDGFLAALRSVARGRTYAAPAGADDLGGDSTDPEYGRAFALDPLRVLTPRQRAVFECAVRGLSVKDTAAELGLAPKTVEIHRTSINRKLRLRGAADTIRFASIDDLLRSANPG